MNDRTAIWAIVPAAGAGRRMESDTPKQYLPLLGRPLLAHSCTALISHTAIESLVLVVAPHDEQWRTAIDGPQNQHVIVVAGGEERCHSVFNGLDALKDRAGPDDWVLVHDAARPCLSASDLERLLNAIDGNPVGGLLGIPVRDTMKRTDADGRVIATVDRSSLWHALTPQVFRYGLLFDALERVLASGDRVTDEAEAIERLGHQPLMVEGCATNLKVTRPEDLPLAEWYLRQQQGGKP